MKKVLLILAIITLYSMQIWSQNWVSLTRNEPAQPEIALNSSNNQQVTFTVALPGFFSTLVTEAGVNYQRIVIQGCGVQGKAGEPEMPVISKRIAVPVCSQVNCSVQITATQTLTGYKVYPTPELQPDSAGKLQEVFTLTAPVYLQNAYTPNESYFITEAGAMRNQHFVTIEIYPIQFNPVTETLQVATEMEITLTFDNPASDVNANTGIFNNVATHTFLNYQDQGIKASINDKAFEKANFTPGNVQWITLTDTAQAKDIVADYLIICAGAFFNSQCSEVQRIAEHRAWYNGFDVAILNVEHILSDDLGFYYEGNPDPNGNPIKFKNEQRIRTCIRRIYEGQNAAHTFDGHLGYVLLIGDVQSKSGDGKGTGPQEFGIPTSYEYHDPNTIYKGVSDYYYSCVTRDYAGVYDKVGDLYIGRFCVAPNLTNGLEELHNMVEKTIYFESEYSFGGWRNRVHLSNGNSMAYLDYWDEYYALMNSLMHEQELHYVNYFLHGFHDYGTLIVELINNGSPFFLFQGHGIEEEWQFGMSASLLKDSLTNVGKVPFCFTGACLVGSFHTHKCLAQQMTSYSPDKGFVAMIAASNSVYYVIPNIPYISDPPIRMHERAPYSIYQNLSHIAGEIFIETILGSAVSVDILYFNLFGDPALNIMADGFEVTRDITVNEITDISCRVRVHNDATVTIPSQGVVYFHHKGQLIIEENGNMDIQDNVQITGINNAVDNSIHVKGGGFTVGTDVVFTNLTNGILIDNPIETYDDNKKYVFDYVTFNSTPFTHSGSRLSVTNSFFNTGSNVKTSASKSVINSCSFNNTTFLSDHLNLSGVQPNFPYTTVINSFFSGNSNSNTAIKFNNSTKYIISNNVITGYDIGISLHSSGKTLSSTGKGIDQGNPIATSQDLVQKNSISNCYLGIEVYSSVGQFNRNQIYNNNFGIGLYNNSNTSFGTATEPVEPPYQTIRDCSFYELYASKNSFPVIFRYNQIIDEDNLGNSNDDPMIYWDIPPKDLKTPKDISYNCFGENFNPAEDLYPTIAFIYTPTWDPGKKSSPAPTDDELLYLTALTYFSEEDYNNTKTTFKHLIETYPQSQFAISAMHELFALCSYTDYDYATLHNYYTSFTPSDSNLFNVADFLATRCFVKEKIWQPAINWYENRIENPPSYQDSIFAVIDLGNIHLMMEADTIGGNGTKSGSHFYYRLENIKPKSTKEYEANKTGLLATLPQIKKLQSEKLLINDKDKKGALSQNIPNPTNGTTTINYEVYIGGSVEIRIYNSMGQLLKSLPQGVIQPGVYQTKINISSFPMGLYQYSLLINGEQADVKKMIVN